MNVASLMTPAPLTVEPGVPADAALRMMDDHGIRHLPVVVGESVVGVLSDRDLFTRTGWRLLGGHGQRAEVGQTLEELMQRHFVTVGPEEDATAALIEFVNQGIGCVLVMEDGLLRGIVTETDLLGLDPSASESTGAKLNNDPPVDEIASLGVVSVSSNATLERVDDLVHAKGHRHLPVVDNGKLVGIVSDRDLRRAVGAHLAVDVPIAELMTSKVHTVPAGTRLSVAAALMANHKISALPVVDGSELQLLTTTDVLKYRLNVARNSASG